MDLENILHEKIKDSISSLISVEQHDFASQRTSADQIEHMARSLLLESDPRFCPPLGTRHPGDVRYVDNNTVHINIKSMDLEKQFHMPNLISAENLFKLLDKGDHFMLLKFHHRLGCIESWQLWNIQDIDWSCLQISALGTGQIQLRDGKKDIIKSHCDRQQWRCLLKENVLKFYDKEKNKIDKRISKWQGRLI